MSVYVALIFHFIQTPAPRDRQHLFKQTLNVLEASTSTQLLKRRRLLDLSIQSQNDTIQTALVPKHSLHPDQTNKLLHRESEISCPLFSASIHHINRLSSCIFSLIWCASDVQYSPACGQERKSSFRLAEDLLLKAMAVFKDAAKGTWLCICSQRHVRRSERRVRLKDTVGWKTANGQQTNANDWQLCRRHAAEASVCNFKMKNLRLDKDFHGGVLEEEEDFKTHCTTSRRKNESDTIDQLEGNRRLHWSKWHHYN